MALVFLSATGFAGAGEISVGVQYDGWSTDYSSTVGGSEIMVPVSAYFKIDPALSFYGESAFADGSYTDDAIAGTTTLSLSDLTDTVVGSDLHFHSFGVPSVANIAVNLPTGDSTWEEKEQTYLNVPTEFIDTRYRGRGFGVSGFYGLSFQTGQTSQFGAGVGYLYSGSFDAGQGLPDLDLGDSIYLALNRVEAFSGDKSSVIRLSGMAFLPTQTNGQTIFQMGPNIDASYGFSDPKGLSYEIGGQFFTPAGRPNSAGVIQTEAHNSFGQRFYIAPSLTFDKLTVAGIVKYVTANDYAVGETFYDGGGLLAGLNPTLLVPLNDVSNLKFNAGYDFIIYHNAASSGGSAADVDYNFWSCGANYEIKI